MRSEKTDGEGCKMEEKERKMKKKERTRKLRIWKTLIQYFNLDREDIT